MLLVAVHILRTLVLNAASVGLTINGWTGVPNTTGLAGKLIFLSAGVGSNPSTTYSTFLSTVQFTGFGSSATFIASGSDFELVPGTAAIPEPTRLLLVASLGMIGCWMLRRRMRPTIVEPAA